MPEMPLYQCHKTVRALKIARIECKSGEGVSLIFEEPGFPPEQVPVDWLDDYQAEAGGYYVLFDEKWGSFCSKSAFEGSYTCIEPEKLKMSVADIISANPGCVAIVDNGSWTIYRKHPRNAPDGAEEKWLKQNTLASGDDLQMLAAAGIDLEVESV